MVIAMSLSRKVSARSAPKGGREHGPGAHRASAKSAGGEFHQFDGLQIDDRTADPFGCIRTHDRLVAERIAQDARLAPAGYRD
jgi:hypothetical protein